MDYIYPPSKNSNRYHQQPQPHQQQLHQPNSINQNNRVRHGHPFQPQQQQIFVNGNLPTSQLLGSGSPLLSQIIIPSSTSNCTSNSSIPSFSSVNQFNFPLRSTAVSSLFSTSTSNSNNSTSYSKYRLKQFSVKNCSISENDTDNNNKNQSQNSSQNQYRIQNGYQTQQKSSRLEEKSKLGKIPLLGGNSNLYHNLDLGFDRDRDCDREHKQIEPLRDVVIMSSQGVQGNNRNDVGVGNGAGTGVREQVQPQYKRIYKRGEYIPGISCPLNQCMTNPLTNSNSISNSNSNSNSNMETIVTNTLNGNSGNGNGSGGLVEGMGHQNLLGNVNVNVKTESNDFGECFNGSNSDSIGGVGVSGASGGDLGQGQLHPSDGHGGDSDGNLQGRGQRDRSSNNSNRTPISLITDIARFHGIKAEYRLTNETGPPHAPTFTVVLSLGNEQYQSQGPSIKKAQLAAATSAVEKTSLKPPPPRAQPKKAFHAGGAKRSNWTILQLNSLAEELNEKITFTSQPVQILNPFNKVDPPSLVVVNVGDKVFTGEGHNISVAKNNAALSALKALVQLKQEREMTRMQENAETIDEESDSLDSDIKSPISIIHEMALKRGLKVTFEIKDEQGPPHMKVFTILCQVGALETEGEGPTKQHAKKVASELMMVKLKEIPMKQPKVTSLKSIQSGVLKAKPKVARKKPATPVIKEVDKQVVSPISRLLQIAHVKKYKEPEFALVVKQSESTGPEATAAASKNQDRRNNRKKKPFFTMQVTVGPYVCQGSGSNKKMAKKAAADAALVLLGYAPTEVKENKGSEKKERIEENTVNSLITTAINETTKKCADLKITATRQIVPGVLVIHDESKDSSKSSASPATAAQEMVKVNSMSTQQPTTFRTLDGSGKLAYLAELLGISVSYSDFPKKNEFLSVASLGTNPPHVAHGIGPTREEAQNSAAVQILEELSTSGLDGVTTNSSNTGSSSAAASVPVKLEQ